MDSSDSANARGFQFPGRFEITVMGAADAGLDRLVAEVLEQAGLRVDRGSLRQRASSKGAYVSVAISFDAASRDDYDGAHAALRARPEVKWTL